MFFRSPINLEHNTQLHMHEGWYGHAGKERQCFVKFSLFLSS